MTAAKWSIVHQGRKFLAATKREAAELARELANATGLSVTVRPVRGSSKTAGRRSVKRNPTPAVGRRRQRVGAHDEKLAYFAGVIAARDGKPRASNPHYGKEATAWRAGYDVVAKAYRPNPDPGSFLPVWHEQEKGRRMRLDYLAATKGRRLAKGLRGRDRGGAVKAAERGAQKTAKFQVYGTKGKEQFHVGRPSRHQAEVTAEQLAAAGYKVRIVEGSIW